MVPNVIYINLNKIINYWNVFLLGKKFKSLFGVNMIALFMESIKMAIINGMLLEGLKILMRRRII